MAKGEKKKGEGENVNKVNREKKKVEKERGT